MTYNDKHRRGTEQRHTQGALTAMSNITIKTWYDAHSSFSGDGVNEAASADKYGNLLEAAILKSYPGADVSVIGPTVFTRSTEVWVGNDSEATSTEAAEIAEDVDRIAQSVYEAGEYWVEA